VRKLFFYVLTILALVPVESVRCAELRDMLGRWTWRDSTIEVRECGSKRVCAKVVAGPKNVGMEIFASQLVAKNGAWFGQVVDPDTGAAYNTRMQFTAAQTWRLDGCNSSGVCLSGEFTRTN
jgi:uncharacterized protein (DUF2147 family)